jgi:hypothetical protein
MCRWFCVSLQYVTKLDMPLLEESLRNVAGFPKLSRRAFHLQVAPESECVDMTGFVRNAITPFGCRGPPVPVILSAAASRASPAFIWLGGGEVSAKLRIPIKEFIRSLGASVLHCTVSNDGNESD